MAYFSEPSIFLASLKATANQPRSLRWGPQELVVLHTELQEPGPRRRTRRRPTHRLPERLFD